MASRIVFRTNPAVRRSQRGRFVTLEPLEVEVNDLRFVVPAMFSTDGASVPPIFWPVVGHPYSPSSLRAAILHDRLCQLGELSGLSSRRVHEIFLESLRAEGVAAARAWCMFAAVSLFGPRWSLNG